jgi:hypothetical protein
MWKITALLLAFATAGMAQQQKGKAVPRTQQRSAPIIAARPGGAPSVVVSGGSGVPECSETVATNCVQMRDAAGNLNIGTTVVSPTEGMRGPAPVKTESGTAYTLAAADSGKVLVFTSATNVTLTVPSGLDAGFGCLIVQLGAGRVTPTASGTTIRQRESLTRTAGQYAIATLIAYASDTFVLSGDLE